MWLYCPFFVISLDQYWFFLSESSDLTLYLNLPAPPPPTLSPYVPLLSETFTLAIWDAFKSENSVSYTDLCLIIFWLIFRLDSSCIFLAHNYAGDIDHCLSSKIERGFWNGHDWYVKPWLDVSFFPCYIFMFFLRCFTACCNLVVYSYELCCSSIQWWVKDQLFPPLTSTMGS